MGRRKNELESEYYSIVRQNALRDGEDPAKTIQGIKDKIINPLGVLNNHELSRKISIYLRKKNYSAKGFNNKRRPPQN